MGLLPNANTQLNVEFRSQVEYDQDLNDIWGYAAPDGREYAIVGLREGVNIVDVTDPENPVDMGTAPGPSSTWRDIKTWGEYAYITNENSGGVLVIDLANLPIPITEDDYYYLTPEVPGEGMISSVHNIFIDEFGFAYLPGSNTNSGGVVIFDVETDPGQMIYVGKTPNIYAHDAYARENKLYTSDIYEGEFSIYDVSDKSNLQLLGSQGTAFEFTHNVWLNDDHTVAFTTDERADAPVGSYDITDPQNIVELDQFKPVATLGDGVIPHNVHVWNDWIIVSYYTDGCLVIDGSVPDNLIEVGNFDTFLPAITGFSGAWGAYPFLPSQTILVADIGNGLYVLTPNYVRACRLIGNVTDAADGKSLTDVKIEIDEPQPNLGTTDIEGNYKTGIATAGTYNVTYSKVGYLPAVIPVDFENGVTAVQDVQLVSLLEINGIVIDGTNGEAIANANVTVSTPLGDVQAYTDINGVFAFPGLPDGNYPTAVGAWGYQAFAGEIEMAQGTQITFTLNKGFIDDFSTDQGWITFSTAGTGHWEWGVPNGTVYQGSQSNPGEDIPNDVADKCYVTGNAGGSAPSDDVDNGVVTLSSPPIDLSGYDYPVLEFYYWWFNAGGNSTPNDTLRVVLNNSTQSIEAAEFTSTAQWVKHSIAIADYITPDSNVRIDFITSDLQGSGHIVEAGIDGLRIVDGATAGIYPNFTSDIQEGCAPFTVNFSDNSDSTVNYLWSFPGGTPATSTSPSVDVTYNTPGNFAASLQVEVESGTLYNLVNNNYINVSSLPYLSFSYALSNGTVYFTGNISNSDNFNWDFGDGTSSTDNNPTHVYTENGTYTVTLSGTNECGDFEFSSDVEIVIATGTEELGVAAEIHVLPNPSLELFSVQYDLRELNNGHIHLTDVNGRSILTQELNNRIGSFEFGENLAPGIYFMTLESDGVIQDHQKLIKL